MARTYKSLKWSDVKEGEELPAITQALTLTRMVIAAGGERDFAIIHHDAEATAKTGNRTAFAQTAHQQALLQKIADEWMGPTGRLKRLQMSMRAPAYLGTTVTGKGKVVKKYQDGGENLVELELSLSTEDGPTTTSSATVALPL